MFNAFVKPYQEALDKSGYKHKLIYYSTQVKAKPKNQSRKVIWFNPPWSTTCKSNIIRDFFKLLEKHFPVSSPLHTLFNRNSVIASYSTMPNMGRILKSNLCKKVSPVASSSPTCNCREECPLPGTCRAKSVVYKAEVSAQAPAEFRTYIGLTKN